MSSKQKKADQYDDPNYNYMDYWNARTYEHRAEVMAIRRLVGDKRFKNAVDIGGGYGRLSVLLSEFSDHVTLTEPSHRQLEFADDFLKDYPKIDKQLMTADNLTFADQSVDFLIMIRVMHHLPDPTAEFREIHRILTDDGYSIIEVANYMHARNRLKYFMMGKKMPKQPVDIRSRKNRNDDEIAFVNHNPKTVIHQLAHAGLKVDRILSVSNLRSTALKKIIPENVMIAIEGALQPSLAKTFFGPSVFFLVRKAP